MGIFSPSLKRNAYVPPSDAAASPTLLTGGDPNVMRVAGGSDPAASNDDVQVAQQRRPQSTPSDAGSLAGRDSSKMYLKFNGRSLSLYDGDSVVAQWPGVSGRENFGSGLTFGRKDMAIHGGWVPGSAGCIDLTGNMASFAKTFRSLGYDLRLYVDYNKTPP
jgi:hypothetical protein